jgi:hypothetical protein
VRGVGVCYGVRAARVGGSAGAGGGALPNGGGVGAAMRRRARTEARVALVLMRVGIRGLRAIACARARQPSPSLFSVPLSTPSL